MRITIPPQNNNKILILALVYIISNKPGNNNLFCENDFKPLFQTRINKIHNGSNY
jgi:hypothetical protein